MRDNNSSPSPPSLRTPLVFFSQRTNTEEAGCSCLAENFRCCPRCSSIVLETSGLNDVAARLSASWKAGAVSNERAAHSVHELAAWRRLAWASSQCPTTTGRYNASSSSRRHYDRSRRGPRTLFRSVVAPRCSPPGPPVDGALFLRSTIDPPGGGGALLDEIVPFSSTAPRTSSRERRRGPRRRTLPAPSSHIGDQRVVRVEEHVHLGAEDPPAWRPASGPAIEGTKEARDADLRPAVLAGGRVLLHDLSVDHLEPAPDLGEGQKILQGGGTGQLPSGDGVHEKKVPSCVKAAQGIRLAVTPRRRRGGAARASSLEPKLRLTLPLVSLMRTPYHSKVCVQGVLGGARGASSPARAQVSESKRRMPGHDDAVVLALHLGEEGSHAADWPQ